MHAAALIEVGRDEEALALVEREGVEDGDVWHPGFFARMVTAFHAAGRRRLPGEWQKDIAPQFKES